MVAPLRHQRVEAGAERADGMGHRAERRGAHVIEMTPNMLCAAASMNAPVLCPRWQRVMLAEPIRIENKHLQDFAIGERPDHGVGNDVQRRWSGPWPARPPAVQGPALSQRAIRAIASRMSSSERA